MSCDVLVTGGGGMLAHALNAMCAEQNLACIALPKSRLDVTESDAVHRFVEQVRPRVIIQCAAFTRVDDAESQPDLAHAVNAQGAENVARAARAVGARFVYPSTDYVFDGAASAPIPPDATPRPINVYGASKLAGEQAAREAGDWVVIRMSWLFGAGGRNFVRTMLGRMRQQQEVRVVSDQVGGPSWTRDVAAATLALTMRAPPGTYHIANAGVASWFDVAGEIARICGLSTRVAGCSTAEFAAAAPRPRYSVLDPSASATWTPLPGPWQGALARAIATGDY